jgi:hypothetical protein
MYNYYQWKCELITRNNKTKKLLALPASQIPRSSFTKFSWAASEDIDQCDKWTLGLTCRGERKEPQPSILVQRTPGKKTSWGASDRKWQMTLTSYVSKRSKGYFGQKQRHVRPHLRLHEICTSAGIVFTQTEITRTKFNPSKTKRICFI